MKKTFILLALWIFPNVFGNGKGITLNQNGEKRLNCTEVNSDDYNRFINKRKDSCITYRQSPKNPTYDAEKMPLEQALEKGFFISWLIYNASRNEFSTRDFYAMYRKFLEKHPDVENKTVAYFIETGNLFQLKLSIKYGIKLCETHLKMAKDHNNKKLEDYIQKVLDNQSDSTFGIQ